MGRELCQTARDRALMILLSCGLEKESKAPTSKQTNKSKPFQSLRHEIGMDQRLRAIEEERYVCKWAQHLGESDTPGSEC